MNSSMLGARNSGSVPTGQTQSSSTVWRCRPLPSRTSLLSLLPWIVDTTRDLIMGIASSNRFASRRHPRQRPLTRNRKARLRANTFEAVMLVKLSSFTCNNNERPPTRRRRLKVAFWFEMISTSITSRKKRSHVSGLRALIEL